MPKTVINKRYISLEDKLLQIFSMKITEKFSYILSTPSTTIFCGSLYSKDQLPQKQIV